MRNSFRNYLLLPLFAGLSFFVNAAPATADAVKESAPMVSPLGVQSAKIDLNKADAATLQRELNGVGKAKADAIVAYREEHGAFTSVDELLEIKGIGKALLERNRSKILVE